MRRRTGRVESFELHIKYRRYQTGLANIALKQSKTNSAQGAKPGQGAERGGEGAEDIAVSSDGPDSGNEPSRLKIGEERAYNDLSEMRLPRVLGKVPLRRLSFSSLEKNAQKDICQDRWIRRKRDDVQGIQGS